MGEATAVLGKTLLAAERREQIALLLARQGVVRVGELSTTLGVSEVTVRNDLDEMAREGLLLRERGGAVTVSRTSLTIAFEQRASLNLDEKRRIGRAAAQLVKPRDTIILDAGTTVMEMAKSLNSVSPLTVVTNALNVTTVLGALPDVDVIQVGGSLSRDTISTVGAHAERTLGELVVSKAFLGTHAMDLVAGVTDTSIEIAQVKQAMIRAARQVILLADSSKWGQIAFAKVAPLRAIHTMVTDSNLTQEARIAIERMGIELILA